MNYPLYKHAKDQLRLPSEQPLDTLSLDNLQAGRLSPRDLGIRAEALIAQAEIAEAEGFRQLGENLRRAAEMTRVPDEEILRIYEALRPGRSSAADLEALAEEVESSYDAPRTATFLREAAAASSG